MSSIAFLVSGSASQPRRHHVDQFATSIPSKLKPLLRDLQKVPLQIDLSKTIKNTYQKLLDALVDSTFRFVDQHWLPSQNNFEPVGEIGEAVAVTAIEGEIPDDFPEGVYIRNGSNPLFGALQATESVFGQSSEIWVEGEGMLHAVYFTKKPSTNNGSSWSVSYKNKYVETETLRLEKERGRPSFLPTIEGFPAAILAAYLLNQLRFGRVTKCISNTNVFEHSGRFFSVAENYMPQEIVMSGLQTSGNWDVGDGAWDRPFTSHPKVAPGSGELVFLGADSKKPFLVLGIVSADGKKLTHKADLKLKRSILCHDFGVTRMYNIILDMPLTIDVTRLIRGGPLIKYEKGSYARIGVMPRYGDADSIKWFQVEPYCTFHLINCYEDGDEVVVMGFKALESIIPGPERGRDKFQWFSQGFKHWKENKEGAEIPAGVLLSRLYEWRLNMKTGNIKEGYLTGTDFSADFPTINNKYTGLPNKYAYVQIVDSEASSICALPKYGRLAKFYLREQADRTSEQENISNSIKVEHHHLGKNQFCSGATFVQRPGSLDEDDGWIVSFIHNEDTYTSQVHIIDAKNFEREPIAKVMLPQRVPYGFHGIFICNSP